MVSVLALGCEQPGACGKTRIVQQSCLIQLICSIGHRRTGQFQIGLGIEIIEVIHLCLPCRAVVDGNIHLLIELPTLGGDHDHPVCPARTVNRRGRRVFHHLE